MSVRRCERFTSGVDLSGALSKTNLLLSKSTVGSITSV